MAERDSEPPLDVTEPPGCVAIDVSDEFAALFYTMVREFRKIERKKAF